MWLGRDKPFDLDQVEHPDKALVTLQRRADRPGKRRLGFS